MKRALQILLPFSILAVSGLVIWYYIASEPEPDRRRFQAPSPKVVVRHLKPVDYPITLHSQGTVRARTESVLIPEVRGRIISTSPNFQDGAFFEEGEVLLEIDDRDYQTELVVADAALAQAELTLEQESARYEQAERDWSRLNPGVTASGLTLREPQIRQARAAVASAQARLETAKVNLERTKVKAPFAGRVLSKAVDLGQYVSPGNELARVYAVDVAEVRLPLSASQYAQLDMPAIYRGQNVAFGEGPKVTLRNSIGGVTNAWEGRIARSEGSVDVKTRQIFVIAQIENPYGLTKEGRPPLKVGSFVQAEIEGRILEDVYLVPRALYRENSYVLVVDDDGYLARTPIQSIWEDDAAVVVRDGLSEGVQLCLTDVPFALEGWPVVASLETSESDTMLTSDKPKPLEERRRPRPAPAQGGLDSRIDGMLAEFGERLPDDLRTRLIALKGSSDFTQIGPVMSELKSWAKQNGVSLPESGGAWGGSPRG